MSDPKPLTYFITGANRGLGRGYVETYLARPNTTVIAAVRNPSHPTSQSLESLPAGSGSVLHVVKLDNAIPTDPAEAIAQIVKLGISRIDVTIANAAIVGSRLRIAAVTLEENNELMQVNAWSILSLFQAALKADLLPAGAKFVLTGTGLGSIGAIDQVPFHDASYSFSKVVVHFMSKKIQYEHPDLTVFLLDPGLPATEMGIAGVKAHLGSDQIFQTVEETVKGCVDKIDTATREAQGGQYVKWDSQPMPW